MSRALVLFGHGARDPAWARPFHVLRERLTLREPGLVVELAFLDFIPPSLAEVTAKLAAGGVRNVGVLPVFISQGGHVKADVNRLVEVERRRHPGLAIEQLAAIGEVEAVLDAIVDYALGSPPTAGR
jgi:sirohydrochlorin cobaltochelatase